MKTAEGGPTIRDINENGHHTICYNLAHVKRQPSTAHGELLAEHGEEIFALFTGGRKSHSRLKSPEGLCPGADAVTPNMKGRYAFT